jgi:hypothetical protein
MMSQAGENSSSSSHDRSEHDEIQSLRRSPEETRKPSRAKYPDKYGRNESSEDAEIDLSSKMWDFSHGEKPELWYKFKRFETLGLHNLYLLQDQLVRFQRDLDWRGGKMTKKDSSTLGNLIKEYCKLRTPIERRGRRD